jgi:short-subunit dehydrogenase
MIMAENTNEYTPTAVVTGASKGIGKAIAIKLLKQGYHVIGTSRSPTKITMDPELAEIQYFPLEITDPASIEKFVERISKVDLLINNAGSSQMGPIEEITMEKVEHYFNLSFFGLVRLTTALIPIMREQRSGKIINISSMASKSPVPFSTYYAAFKSAVNVYTKGLRAELNPYKIQAVAIAPGPVHTSIPQDIQLKNNSLYREKFGAAQEARNKSIENGVSPEYIANQIWKILQKKTPKPYYAVGKNARFLNFLNKHLPSHYTEKIIWKRYNIG